MKYMEVSIFDTKGKKTDKGFVLDTKMFASEVHPMVLRQALHVHMLNTRTGTAKAKNRGEVSGTGVKPWKNNKVGRARTGDLRTPIFRHGGVSHGPVPMYYGKKLPRKVAQSALAVALTQCVTGKKLFILEDLKLPETRVTHTVAMMLDALAKSAHADMRRAIVYYWQTDDAMVRAFRNIPRVLFRDVRMMHAYDIVQSSAVILLASAMQHVNKTEAVSLKKDTEAKSATVKKAVTKKKITQAT